MQSQRTNKRSSILQIYDLRREARLREAREWFYKNYFVENLDDWMGIAYREEYIRSQRNNEPGTRSG